MKPIQMKPLFFQNRGKLPATILAVASIACLGLAQKTEAAITLYATQDAYVLESSPNVNDNSDLIITKDEIGAGLVNRKSWIQFDLGDGILDLSKKATFSLTLGEVIERGRPESNPNLMVGVYALLSGFVPEAGELGTNWSESSLTWNNAPGNSGPANSLDLDDVSFLGSISVLYGQAAGTNYDLDIVNPGLFRQADDSLTIILVGLSESDSNARFASSENLDFSGPSLTFSAIPEPSTCLFPLLLASLLLSSRDRSREPRQPSFPRTPVRLNGSFRGLPRNASS